MLQRLSQRFASNGVQVLLVSVDEPETEGKVAAMLREYGVNPPYYIASRPLGPFKQAMHPEWPGNVPVTFLFDPAGRRRYFWGGPVMEREIRPLLERFARGEAVDGETLFQLAPGKTME